MQRNHKSLICRFRLRLYFLCLLNAAFKILELFPDGCIDNFSLNEDFYSSQNRRLDLIGEFNILFQKFAGLFLKGTQLLIRKRYG